MERNSFLLNMFIPDKRDINKIWPVLKNLGYTISFQNNLCFIESMDEERNNLIDELKNRNIGFQVFINISNDIRINEKHFKLNPITGIVKNKIRDEYADGLLDCYKDNRKFFDAKPKIFNGIHYPIIMINDSVIKTERFNTFEDKVSEDLSPKYPNITNSEHREEHNIWKNILPTDELDPASIHENKYHVVDDIWSISVASLRGKSHAHEGKHRDDSFSCETQNGWSIIAVADGAGSCRLSRVGAKIACQTATAYLKQCLNSDFCLNGDDGASIEFSIPNEEDLLLIRHFLISAINDAITTISKEAKSRQINKDELSTTLLLAIHHEWGNKSLVASIQVGDGAIALWHGGKNISIMGTADSGSYGGETKFITSNSLDKELSTRVFFAIKPDVDAIVLMTDGVSDDFFPYDKFMPGMFEEIICKLIGTENPEAALLEWLAYERRGSFDDRTIAVLYRR